MVSSQLLIHLITVQNEAEPVRMSLIKKTVFDQNFVSFYTSIPFNIVFADIYKNYYLIILQQEANVSGIISTDIKLSHRCASITEVFNESVVNLHLLKRIKLYHIPCRERLELVCFVDSIHICLCNLDRQANCFEFNHTSIYDCRGYNLCENDGTCFQDNSDCPTTATCLCNDCYYGSKCQFSH